jgi:integrase
MAVKKITKRVVDDLAQGAMVWDTECRNFGVRRQTHGAFYVLRYRVGPKQRMMSIGRHGAPWTPDEARREARRLQGIIYDGVDPLAERHTERLPVTTLGPVIDRYLARREPGMRPRSFVEITRHLRKHASPLHGLALDAVTRRAVAQLLGEIEERSGPTERNRVRASLSKLWNWLISEGLAEVNVISATGKAEEHPPHRVLTEAELASVWRSLGDDQFGDTVRLLILTGQRRGEIGALRWSEIAGDTIILPASRTKNKREHRLPLSPQAARIIARQPRRDGRDLIFGFGDRGFMSWTTNKAKLDALCGFSDWTLHDLRRTAATMMAENLRVQPHIIEAVLNHVSGHKAGVAGKYNRATYAEEMREALVKWADYIDGMTGENSPATISEAPRDLLPVRLVHHA